MHWRVQSVMGAGWLPSLPAVTKMSSKMNRPASDSRPRYPRWPWALTLLVAGCGPRGEPDAGSAIADHQRSPATTSSSTDVDTATIEAGKRIFRFETCDEALWTDKPRLHEVVRTAVGPATALTVGLKVDAEAFPPDVVAGSRVERRSDRSRHDRGAAQARCRRRRHGQVETIEGKDRSRVGITCALCHSTVDDSFSPGIGHRLDGWPNRDLDPGAIIACHRR